VTASVTETTTKLALEGLTVSFGEHRVVEVERLELGVGEILGVAGESGSGKSSMANAVLGLSGYLGATLGGSIRLDGRELVGLPERELREIRGKQIAMIFQNPVATFNPTFAIGDIFRRALRLHGASKSEAKERAVAAMAEVLLPAEILDRYPHEVSGGQAQRTAIALAVALEAELLLADEPTSALDVTVQSEVIEILRRVREQQGLSVLLISHDLAVLGELCERIAVMKDGRVVEQGTTDQVLKRPEHPYTRELIASVLTVETPAAQGAGDA
jgi:peptide/nickel transport system ATP-binding protein